MDGGSRPQEARGLSGGRRSRSSSAARPLAMALALALVSTLPRGALSQGLALPPLPNQPSPHRNQNRTCGDIPPPFGIRGNEPPPGFEVTCGPNMEAMLLIDGLTYKINDVSVAESNVIIFAGPIQQVCYGRNGEPAPATGTGSMNLQGTPFTFSRRNRLVNIGCNYILDAAFKAPGDPGPWSRISCSTSCHLDSASIKGYCQGEACCYEDVPDTGKGAQAFKLSFSRSPPAKAVTPEELGTCSAVFFLDKDDQIFTPSGLREGAVPLKEALLPPGERRMVLDWAIGNSTCEQARSYNFAPNLYCNNMSTCVDAASGAGYLCKCYEGYDGNPYVANGCEDIDECRYHNSNNCTYQNYCNNIPGSYNCSCPDNIPGDGYRTGTGCNGTLVASGLPTQQSQGPRVCNHPEKNPCTYPAYCNDVQGVACGCPQGMSGDGKKMGSSCQKHFPLDTALGVGLALVVTVTTAALCYCWALKRREVTRKRAALFRKNGGLLLQQRFSTLASKGEQQSAKIFSAEELKIATDNYSESRILGRGAHGTVYKGILPDRTVVAIKKSKVFDESQVEQFVNEITILSQIDHPNVVKLLGCCLDIQVPLLVYEFIPNGTLFQHIHSGNGPRHLTWEDCLRIAAEIAEAIAYLHSTSSIPIIHRDIKSSNILLDESFVAKIADFGASRSVPFDQTHISTLIQGTIGYLDPEYFQSSQLTAKSDVYSFGVVLAELLTRQKPISVARPEESCNLAMYLVVLYNEGRLLQEIEPHILEEAGEEQVYVVAELSVRCLNLKGEERPSMKEVASVLNGLRTFTIEQTIRRQHESVVKSSERNEEHLVSEIRTISSLQSSEISTQCSMESEMPSSSHMPDDVPVTLTYNAR